MVLLRMMGIEMSDEASKTFGGGIRNYLGALGFISALIGAEILREGGDSRVGMGLVVTGLPVFILPWLWDRFMARLSNQRSKLRSFDDG
jgi:hypothetical protein